MERPTHHVTIQHWKDQVRCQQDGLRDDSCILYFAGDPGKSTADAHIIS